MDDGQETFKAGCGQAGQGRRTWICSGLSVALWPALTEPSTGSREGNTQEGRPRDSGDTAGTGICCSLYLGKCYRLAWGGCHSCCGPGEKQASVGRAHVRRGDVRGDEGEVRDAVVLRPHLGTEGRGQRRGRWTGRRAAGACEVLGEAKGGAKGGGCVAAGVQNGMT